MIDTTSRVDTIHVDTMHVDTMRQLTTAELENVCGGLYGSAMLYAAGIQIWLSGCSPTASYTDLCP
jgi:hypothetical protein